MKALASETAESIKLPEDVKERLDELRALSEKAEAGEKGARQELNQALLKSWQEQAHRRLLSAIKTLARVRKLQSNAPSVQLNQQINSGGSALRGAESLSNERGGTL